MLKKNMRIDNFLISICILTIFVIACTKIDSNLTEDSCILFKEKKNWYKATKKSYDKWGAPISLQLAIVKQESSFNQFAKPKRKKIFGIIPSPKRPSTAFGFAQVTNPTWDWYKKSTGNTNASRANFNDISDFIGWYVNNSHKMLGLSKKDTYNQYLAYHEGHNGWKNQSYKTKKWLIDVAKKVEKNSKKYNNQLIKCENQLNKKGIFGLL
ncbi:MAG: hypothetical protein CFH19_00473 [Alphaproteobacteria bacterium MarineAlpha5_Bin9]|nr:MAG: hypothetical protein CFH19_00473 [Alphaproteobacteria bacterium MarineAlpha5_Bin9]|tara:strand:+ start:4443 stop:5075 length:633 start_codon:yes stop_codon:yes gene_type:complete